MSIGDALAQARRQAGLTIAQVSQRTCIRETIIRGIERDDFSACGGDFYTRGHIRSVARAVGLDPEPLIREYDTTYGAHQQITAADVFEPATPISFKERRRSPNWSVAMVLLLAVLLGYGVYRLAFSGGGTARPAASPAHHAHSTGTRSRPAATPSPARRPVAHHNVVIKLTAQADCWVGFSRPNGAQLSQTTVVAGTTKIWTFRHAVVMSIGNPGSIVLTVNGKNVGGLGSGGGGPLTLSFGPHHRLSVTAPG